MLALVLLVDRVKSCTASVSVVLCEREPVAPVIVTEYDPGAEELQDIVAVPELSTLLGAIAEHVNPDATLPVSVTLPVNPLTADTVVVIVAETPALIEDGALEEIVKSVTMNRVVVA